METGWWEKATALPPFASRTGQGLRRVSPPFGAAFLKEKKHRRRKWLRCFL